MTQLHPQALSTLLGALVHEGVDPHQIERAVMRVQEIVPGDDRFAGSPLIRAFAMEQARFVESSSTWGVPRPPRGPTGAMVRIATTSSVTGMEVAREAAYEAETIGACLDRHAPNPVTGAVFQVTVLSRPPLARPFDPLATAGDPELGVRTT